MCYSKGYITNLEKERDNLQIKFDLLQAAIRTSDTPHCEFCLWKDEDIFKQGFSHCRTAYFDNCDFEFDEEYFIHRESNENDK